MKRDPRLLYGAVASAAVLALLASVGCGHSRHLETQRSRDINECVYEVQFVGPRLPPAAEADAIKRCHDL